MQQPPDWKVGDKLRYNGTGCDQLTEGEIYEIATVPEETLADLSGYVTVWNKDRTRKHGAFCRRFTKVEEPMTEFKVGDRVRAIRAYEGWLEVGQIYTVTCGGSYSINIRHPARGEGGFPARYFELVENPTLTLSGEVVGDELVLPGNLRVKLPKELIPESPELRDVRAKIVQVMERTSRPTAAKRIANKEADAVIKEVFNV